MPGGDTAAQETATVLQQISPIKEMMDVLHKRLVNKSKDRDSKWWVVLSTKFALKRWHLIWDLTGETEPSMEKPGWYLRGAGGAVGRQEATTAVWVAGHGDLSEGSPRKDVSASCNKDAFSSPSIASKGTLHHWIISTKLKFQARKQQCFLHVIQTLKISEPHGLPFHELFFFRTRPWDEICYYDKWLCFRFDHCFHLVLPVQAILPIYSW